MSDSSRIERLPPQSIEAEEAVLGALLIDPDAIIRVATVLRPEDFYREKHGWIYDVDLCLHERREPIDFLTVCEELEHRNQLAEVGGPAFITSLINTVPTSVHAEHYAHIVERTATLRRLIDAASQIAVLGYQETDDVDEVVDHAEQILFGVSQRRIARDLVPIKQVLSEYYDRIEYLTRHRGELIGIPTGFGDIDKLLGGLQRSDLIILAARPSVGKSSLALSIAHNAAKKYKQRIALFSLEMSSEQVVQRLISAETRIDSQRLRRGEIAEDEWGRFMKATGDLADTLFFVDDTPGISALELRTKARRLHAEFGLDLVVVDYLQLMRGDTHSENRVQEVSYISRALKALARELNLPVLALSQLSRGVESRTDKKPILSDLRESGCLAGDTLVTLADSGLRVPIRELAGKSGFDVWALNPATLKLDRATVSRAFATGSKPVFRLTTRLGRTIRATANHRFLTARGWKRLDEVHPGDYIALPRQSAIGLQYCGTGLNKQNVSRERAARVEAIVRSADLQLLAESDIYWDGVVTIEADGEDQVFDLTVPGHSSFVADNIIVHNSLEQDADVVMFIYRDELYNDNTERKNIADVIVAKHRNGPTGTVALYFQKELALFREAELRRTELDNY